MPPEFVAGPIALPEVFSRHAGPLEIEHHVIELLPQVVVVEVVVPFALVVMIVTAVAAALRLPSTSFTDRRRGAGLAAAAAFALIKARGSGGF